MEIAMTDLERKQALRRAAGGDANAFGSLYAEIAADLYRFALWSLKNKEDAEDAVQEACLSAWKGLTNLKKPEAFKSWMLKILSNRCRDVLRQRSGVRLVELSDAEGELPPVWADFPEDGAKDLLSGLSDEDRQIVLLSVYAGFKSGEIGESLGLKAATVRSRLSRALQQIRLKMEEESL